MTMRSTRIGIADNARQTAIGLLQTALTDALDLRLSVKQAHWTVSGPHFQPLHELFDSFIGPLDTEIDQLAERIATLGGTPDGRAKTVAATSSLGTYPIDAKGGNTHLKLLAERFAALGQTVRDSIAAADSVGDAGTADIFTATSRFMDQSLWFLEAHLES